eukprot:903339_1
MEQYCMWQNGKCAFSVGGRRKCLLWRKGSNIPNAWISFNFGEKKKIKPSHYTLRHHSWNWGYLRHWNFEGSNDGTHWKRLRRHSNDESLNIPHDTHTWEIDADEYYQMFRIFMTHTNNIGLWNVVCAGFEIYGHL